MGKKIKLYKSILFMDDCPQGVLGCLLYRTIDCVTGINDGVEGEKVEHEKITI